MFIFAGITVHVRRNTHESGFSKNWLEYIEEQPFHVLSAISLDADEYAESASTLREAVASIDELELENPLGQGFEIKAKEISAGKGWWKNHKAQRNQLRELMLDFPKANNAHAFLAIIDKQKHRNKYAFPDPPHEIAFQFIFERLQWHLIDTEEVGICIYDQTKFLDDDMHISSANLMREGSPVEYWSEYFGFVAKQFAIDRILEFTLGRSENSVGLQVADYLIKQHPFCKFAILTLA